MNQFTELIKEAFLGEEPYDSARGRAALEASIRKFEGRDRAMRWLMWFAVAAMTALCAWAALRFAAAPPDASVKDLILYATAFLWGSTGVGFAKTFLFSAQANLAVRKELARIRLAWLEERP